MNVFPQYIAVQSRVSRFSWSIFRSDSWSSLFLAVENVLSEVYYIHTKVYSQKSSVHTHMSSGYPVRAKKKWYVQSNPTSEVCEFGAQISAFFGACRLQRARYANCLAEIQRESSYCETKGEWFFALKNVKQSLKSFLYFKFTRKTVESRQNMQQQKWKTKGEVKLKLYSISELYLFLSMFRINYDFF